MSDSWVYFIRLRSMVGPVKIGWSAHPEKRVLELSEWSPYPLAVAARIPGRHREEAQFHAMFADQASHREWFHPSAKLDAVIAEIAAGVFDISTLPPPRRLYRANWSDVQRAAASMTRRLDNLSRSGCEIPRAVRIACERYNCGRFSSLYDPGNLHDPADLELVEAFLAANNKPRPVRVPTPRQASSEAA